MVDFVSKEKRSKIMSSIKGKWTLPERILHNYLKGHKIKHTMHPKLSGNPDALIRESKLVVFVDGDFWHGRNYKKRRAELSKFWRNKIETNMKRDKKNNRILEKSGWKIVRIWEHDIKTDPRKCLGKIMLSIGG